MLMINPVMLQVSKENDLCNNIKIKNFVFFIVVSHSLRVTHELSGKPANQLRLQEYVD